MPKLAPNPLPLLRRAGYIGIDPGANGCLIFYPGPAASAARVSAISAGETPRDVLDWLEAHRSARFAVIEQVGGFIGDGNSNKASAHTMFNFGANYGRLVMGLTAAGIPFESKVPQAWMKPFGMRKDKNETKTAWKGRLKGLAQRLFPQEKVTNANADALLIARYCYLTHKEG